MDSSFVDVTGRKDSTIRSDDSSKSSRISESDEWLDVDVVTSSTTNEERLRNQVRALQRALDEKDLELMETNVQVDVLKGHKILLENARSELQEKLAGQARQVSKLEGDLSAANKQVLELGEKFRSSENMVQSTTTELRSFQAKNIELERQIKNLREVHEKESRIASLKLQGEAKLAKEVKATLMAKEEGIKNRDANLIKLHEELKSSQDQQTVLKQTVASGKQEIDHLQQQVEKMRDDAGSIAVVAENLRVEKQSLDRKLQYSQLKLRESQDRAKELQGVMENMQGAHQQREEEHKQRQLHQKQQIEKDIKVLSDTLSSKIRELEDYITQLAGEVACTREEADHANEALREMKQKHERYSTEQQRLQEISKEREELLLLELAQIRTANEERLEELRQILGLRFRDILMRYKTRLMGTAPSAKTTNPTKVHSNGTYAPPPILRAVIGLV